MLRKNKSDPDRDTARTLIMGVFVALIILFWLEPIVRLFEHYVFRKPWLEASLTIVSPNGGAPEIAYDVQAMTLVDARWRTWTETKRGSRICVVEGPGHYSRDQPAQRWSWDAWFVNRCAVPETPFRVCIRYSVSVPRWAREMSPPFCSEFVGGFGPHQR